jgi:sulfofructose kinase
MGKILGLGGVCIDRLSIIPNIPEWDGLEHITAYATQQGGMVATAMVAVARLGSVAEFIGGVGDDEAGKFALQTFQAADVQTTRLKVFRGEVTSFSIILVQSSTGKRSIIHYKGVQAKPDLDVPALDLTGVQFLHLDSYWLETALLTARQARLQGIPVALDPCSQILSDPRAKELFQVIDYFMPSYTFGVQLTGKTDPQQITAEILTYGAKAVIMTKGEEGCFIRTAKGYEQLPAFAVPVVDTTGAGDVFHGAFLVGLQCGYNLRHAAQFASAVAALKCTKLGGQTGIPTLSETLNFLNKRGICL